MGVDLNAPKALTAVLGRHLRMISEIRDLPPPQNQKSVYILNITGATTDSAGEVVSAGKGTLHGPLNLEASESRHSLYLQWPSLQKRLEAPSPQPLRIFIVSCAVQSRNKKPALHRAVIGLPASRT